MANNIAGGIATVKSNFTAIVPPSVSNDSSQGYAVGSIWIDTNFSKAYRCFSASVGAAEWEEIGAGSSSSGINYITNGTSETDTTGWATYADAAAVTPADGTGGSANITWAVSSVDPLRETSNFLLTKDAVSRQGEGVSFDFTVDNADKAKVLRVSFDYKTSSAYADGDVRVYVYRKDATARLIELSTRDLAANTVNGTYLGEFQTDSDATEYRLILHVASTNASAYTIQADNFSVGPREIARGSVVTDWVAFTPVITNLTIGNGTLYGFRRRVGDTYEYKIGALFGSTTSVGGTISYTLPDSQNIDVTNKTFPVALNETVAGAQSTLFDNSTSATYYGLMQVVNATSIRPIDFSVSGSRVDAQTTNSTTPFTWATSDNIMMHFSLPIVGLSSNANISSDFGGRVIALAVTSSGSQVLTSASTEYKVAFNTVAKDSVAGYDNATNYRYTVKESGTYTIHGNLALSSSASTGYIQARIKKNGTVVKYSTALKTGTASLETHVRYDYQADFVAGDYIEVWAITDIAAGLSLLGDGSAGGYTSLYIEKLSSPQTLIGGEVVSVSAGRTTNIATNVTTATLIVWDTVNDNTHGAYNSATGLFTAPVAGRYQYGVQVLWAAESYTAGADLHIKAYKNGANVHRIGQTIVHATATVAACCNGSDYMVLNAGDTLSFYAYQTQASTRTVQGSNEITRMWIRKVN